MYIEGLESRNAVESAIDAAKALGPLDRWKYPKRIKTWMELLRRRRRRRRATASTT